MLGKFAGKSLVQQRLLQLVQRREFLPVEGFKALGMSSITMLT